MKPEFVRFAAALAQLGGPEARKNSVAARLAGVEGGRTQAFRAARSVAVRKLLAEATKIMTGNLPRISEEEIDQRIDDLIRSPDAPTVAKGIELRHRRDAARLDREAAKGDQMTWEDLSCALLEYGDWGGVWYGCGDGSRPRGRHRLLAVTGGCAAHQA